MMITRIVKIKVKQEFYTNFCYYMQSFLKKVQELETNHYADFFEDKETPFQFHIYTIWHKEVALNKFQTSEINKEFIKKLNLWGEAKAVAWTVQNTK